MKIKSFWFQNSRQDFDEFYEIFLKLFQNTTTLIQSMVSFSTFHHKNYIILILIDSQTSCAWKSRGISHSFLQNKVRGCPIVLIALSRLIERTRIHSWRQFARLMIDSRASFECIDFGNGKMLPSWKWNRVHSITAPHFACSRVVRFHLEQINHSVKHVWQEDIARALSDDGKYSNRGLIRLTDFYHESECRFSNKHGRLSPLCLSRDF